MTKTMKRVIGWGGSGVVLVLALLAIFIDNKREETFAADAPIWPPGPILIAYADDLPGEDVRAAIDMFNNEVDCPVFSVTTWSNAKARLKWLDTEACGGRGKALNTRQHVEGTWDCKDGTVEVQFADLAHPDNRYPTIFHALGHVVGLAHDTSGLSVMLDPPPPMVAGKLAPGLTRKDIGAIRDRLCR